MDLIESYKEELKLIRKPWTKVWVAAFVLLVILLPWYSPEHVVYIASIIFIYTVGVQGQNLLIGYTGQISFGQNGFLAIGAFTFGHLAQHGIPWPIGMIAGGLAAGLFGLVVGFPSLRLKGPYLAIATMGFGIAVYQVFVNSEFLSGGRMGLVIHKMEPLFGLSAINFNYYFRMLTYCYFLCQNQIYFLANLNICLLVALKQTISLHIFQLMQNYILVLLVLNIGYKQNSLRLPT